MTTPPPKQLGIKEVSAILVLIGMIGGGFAWANQVYVPKVLFEAEQKACEKRSQDLKEILTEIKGDIKEIRREQNRRSN